MGSSMFGGWTGSRPMQDARDAVGELGDAARRGYEDAAHRAREAFDHAGDQFGDYKHSLEDMIVSHPVKAVAASLAVGVFLGWLIKRS